MTRTVFLVDHDFPPTDGDMSAAADAGASEVICGIPQALADLGIDSFGYHEIDDDPPPPPPTPPPPPPVDRHAELVAAGFTSEQADAILAIAN